MELAAVEGVDYVCLKIGLYSMDLDLQGVGLDWIWMSD
jgi:hypothetical protein